MNLCDRDTIRALLEPSYEEEAEETVAPAEE